MKKLYSITVSVVLTTVIICSSCQDFLDKNPLDQMSSQTFWQTEADVEMALAGCYSRLQGNFLGFQRIWLDCLSDNAHAEWDYYNIPNMKLGIISSSSGGAIKMAYAQPYKGISSCNFFLSNVDKAPISDEKKKVDKAEVRFLRALMYFDLVNFFGDVILYKTPPQNADEAKIAKSPKADVLAYIHADLDEAIAGLPEAAYSGHAVKGSAKALKAKVLLFEKKWSEAADYALQIMNSGTFRIADNYLGLFLTKTQLGNPEIIFSTEYLSPDNSTGDVEDLNVFLGSYGCIQPIQDLVDDYECIDGKYITESPLYDPKDLTWVNRDPRLKLTMRNSTEEWFKNQWNGQTGYVCRKYLDFSVPYPWGYSNRNSDQDMVYLRYADVLLMYAEAKNEVNGPDPSIYVALDQIRSRPGVNMPPVDRAKYNTQALLREKIRHERRIELALEGHRYFDIKRWEIAHIKMPLLTNPAGIPLKFEQKHYLWPFQQSELDNNPKLVQTPGY